MPASGSPLTPSTLKTRRTRAPWSLTGVFLGCSLAGAVTQALAQAQPAASGAGIYSCIDDHGRRLTSDRPIPECIAKEQRVLNRDGSLRTVRPPTLTPDERADAEARERAASEARAAQADAGRRDRNLLQRYKTEEAHLKAREAALDSVRLSIRLTKARQDDLVKERKPLMDEAEFYVGRTMPAKLKAQLESNDAAMDALRTATTSQQVEVDRINRVYDIELERLRRLWAGAVPGSLGALEAAPPPAAGARRTGKGLSNP